MTGPCVRHALSACWLPTAADRASSPYPLTPPASSVVALDSVGQNANLPHLSRPEYASERLGKGRPEFNGVIWITLPMQRYGGLPIRFMVGYDGWTLSLLGNVGDLETMVPAKSLVFVFCKAALIATQ